MQLTLLVLKTRNVERAVAFYRSFGIEFETEQHGRGPVHFAAAVGETTLEIYPLAAGQTVDTTTRLGFSVGDLAAVIDLIRKTSGAVVKEPSKTQFGVRGIVRDPDGRTIELYAASG